MREPIQTRSRDSTDRVLDAVLQILGEDGLAAVTTARVARDSGVSNGSIYHRFGTRKELLVGALERFTSGLRQDLTDVRAALPETPPDLDTALDLLVAVYRLVFDVHGRLIRAFFVDSLTDRDLADQGEVDKSLFIDQIADFLGAHSAEIEAEEPARAYEMVHRLLFGYFMMRTLFHEDYGDETMLALLTKAVRALLGR